MLTSLSELKAIELQRVADERAAVLRAEELRIEEMAATERRHREQLEARAHAEHEAKLALERARVDAEREARLRVEAAEAAEHARQMMALHEARTVQELEIRRAEVAKQRPTWMLAVTGLALVAAAVMVWLAIASRSASAKADEDRAIAQEVADKAKRDAEASKVALEQVDREVKDLAVKTAAAMVKVAAAQTKADRDAANIQLQRLQHDQFLAARHAQDVRDAASKAARGARVIVDEECTRNSVCKKVK